MQIDVKYYLTYICTNVFTIKTVKHENVKNVKCNKNKQTQKRFAQLRTVPVV